MPRILIVVDSTCDVPPEWVRRFDVRLVPTYVHFGMESLADDGVQLTRQGFYERLAADPLHPTTAAPPPGGVMEVMARALDEAEHVIALTAPKELSGIYNTFRLAAEKLGPERVTLVDGRSTSMGLGWQVVVAGEMIEAGAAPDDIEAALLDMQPQIHVWAALDTIHYLRRSGRVGWATAMVGGLFQIKPVIHLYNAVVESVGRVRTAQRGFDLLADLARKAAPLDRLAVLHTVNLAGAQRLAEALKDIWPEAPLALVEATPVLGVHVGPNGLGLAIVKRRQQDTGSTG
ncbi:MAG: DegV family protein [Chloroflexi bacterium]|nr:DegV family protein [Chloroflexota bacterium]